jgi:hypothetical protein
MYTGSKNAINTDKSNSFSANNAPIASCGEASVWDNDLALVSRTNGQIDTGSVTTLTDLDASRDQPERIVVWLQNCAAWMK